MTDLEHKEMTDEEKKEHRIYTYEEFGCSQPISFITSKGVKTLSPNKKYDENLNEIDLSIYD